MTGRLQCPICSHEYGTGASCHESAAVPYGQESYWRWAGPATGPCNDCGCPVGGYHHQFCDMAECAHGEQMLACPRCAGLPVL